MASTESMKKYCQYYLKKFRDYTFSSVGNLDEENVMLGETYDWTSKNEFYYPRIEMLVHSKNGRAEIDNTTRDEGLILSVACYIYRETEDFKEEDYYKILDFMGEIEKLVYSANNDRRDGNPPNDDFLRIDPYNTMDIEGELDRYLGSGIMNFTIVITKNNFL